MSVKTDTILWLLPIVFMFHDFEEIVMIPPWIRKNNAALIQRYPALAGRLLPALSGLSPSAFSSMVALIFVLISAVTLIAVEFSLYALWMGLLILFFIHLFIHIAQALAYRAYVPVIFTSLGACIYCVFAILALQQRGLIDWRLAGLSTLGITVFALPAFYLILRFGSRFDAWIKNTYPE